MNFKHIHIGEIIEKRIQERKISLLQISDFLKCSEDDVLQILKNDSIDTDTLLKLSKILSYDFFRVYTQHLILYTPPSAGNINEEKAKTTMPVFRKNIYTREVIEFVLEQVNTEQMTKNEVIERYKIPKTTLYKWFSKYQVPINNNDK